MFDRLLIMVVQDYLAGETSLERLQHLLIEITWERAGEASEYSLGLAQYIDLRIAEFTSGHISERVLKDLVREAAGLNSLVATAGTPPSSVWSSAAETRKEAFG